MCCALPGYENIVDYLIYLYIFSASRALDTCVVFSLRWATVDGDDAATRATQANIASLCSTLQWCGMFTFCHHLFATLLHCACAAIFKNVAGCRIPSLEVLTFNPPLCCSRSERVSPVWSCTPAACEFREATTHSFRQYRSAETSRSKTVRHSNAHNLDK